MTFRGESFRPTTLLLWLAPTLAFQTQRSLFLYQPGRLSRHPSPISSAPNSDTIIYNPPTWEVDDTCGVGNGDHIAHSNPEIQNALQSLASTILALLAGDETSATSLLGGAAQKRHVVTKIFQAYDVCESGTLSVEEAQRLFIDLARSMVLELSQGKMSGAINEENSQTQLERDEIKAAQAHAKRVLAEDEAGNTIDRVARKLLLLADTNADGKINLQELAQLFETVFNATMGPEPVEESMSSVPSGSFPQPLRALAGSLQLLPARERAMASEAAEKSKLWNVGVPGDDHSLRQVVLEVGENTKKKKNKQSSQSNEISLIGLGRSADTSAYFLPEMGIALDAGLHVSSLQPKTVLLTHGHRDHIGALPVHASHDALLLVPESIETLVHKFLIAEAQLNYGDASQTDEETLEALGSFNIVGVKDCTRIMLPKDKYMGSPTPLGIQVFEAPHKRGVPAVSYGIFRCKQRLKEDFRGMNNSQLGALLRQKRENGEEEFCITESYDEGLIFYTGDTTISLLRKRWKEILPHYKFIIHEVTFLGPPSSDLDNRVREKGHTHYAQLHPWICAFPETTFICVHWSLRYGREEVLEFFEKNYGGLPKNVVLWL